ncbi:MAG: DJ-1/PfpI family protein [Bacteroidales bacterium]|jgi:cyclohexyl-isocyanide hydratase|nr:DJ-1/PfpI family protein [Bacteroidales bacterium]
MNQSEIQLKPLDQTVKVGILVCPNLFMADVVGVHTVFGISPNVEIHLVWKNLESFEAMPRWPMSATTTFDDCPDVDVLVVGATPPDVMADQETIRFLQEKASKASAVIGICGGTLLLGAAGLLKGRHATTNFQMIGTLKDLGIQTVTGGDVVVDGKYYTAGPVSGSYDAGFRVLAALRGDEVAKLIELALEYHPKPLFNVGTPELAGAELTAMALAQLKDKDMVEVCHQTAVSAYAVNSTN